MNVSGIQAQNNYQNFKALHCDKEVLRSSFLNGNDVVYRYEQEEQQLKEMSKDIDLYIFPGLTPKSPARSKDMNAIRMIAYDPKKDPAIESSFCYAYLLEPHTLTRTAQDAISALNNHAAIEDLG